jgi:tetratricopeptide (TPR) repeat protein
VEVAGAQVAKRKPPESLAAYDCVLRGLEQLNPVGEPHNAEALRFFEKAVELDPQYAVGHAYLALTIYVQWIANRAPGELDRALTIARRALALDENDNRCHRILSHIYTHMRQFDRAEFHSERSVALNPNDAHAAIARANVLRNLGRLEEGVEWVRKALRLNPYHPNWYWNTFARVLHAAGHYAEALDVYSRIAERPSFYDAYVAACHAELGHMEEARAHAESALKVRPDFSIGTWSRGLPYKNDADLQRFLDGLRKAGFRSDAQPGREVRPDVRPVVALRRHPAMGKTCPLYVRKQTLAGGYQLRFVLAAQCERCTRRGTGDAPSPYAAVAGPEFALEAAEILGPVRCTWFDRYSGTVPTFSSTCDGGRARSSQHVKA